MNKELWEILENWSSDNIILMNPDGSIADFTADILDKVLIDNGFTHLKVDRNHDCSEDESIKFKTIKEEDGIQ